VHKQPDHTLVVVAHPDDEVIFFGALIAALSRSGGQVCVACATGDFCSPWMNHVRATEFRRACWRMGVRGQLLGLVDRVGRLDTDELETSLERLARQGEYKGVFTHGVWGEYGHRHHRDVSLSTHRVFGAGVYSLAGPFQPERVVAVGAHELEAKRQVAAQTYFSQPFAAGWCSPKERFVQLPPEVAEVLAAIEQSGPPTFPTNATDRWRALARESLAFFESGRMPFAETANIPPKVWVPAFHVLKKRLREVLDQTL
jgi:LmbE family N-acetylglucosaminyl deacetylase